MNEYMCMICGEEFNNQQEHIDNTGHGIIQGLSPCPLYPHGYKNDR